MYEHSREEGLEDALAALRHVPDLQPGLGAAQIRALGQRRRRQRAATAAGVTAAAVASVLGLGAGLLGGQERTLPRPAGTSTAPSQTPSPTTSQSPTGTASPSPSGTASPSPSGTAPPLPGGTAPPSPGGPASPSPTATLLTTVPADLPIAAGYPSADEAGQPVTPRRGPGPGVELCERTILTGTGAAATTSVSLLNPEDFRTRTLIVYASVERAREAVAWTAREFRRCASDDPAPAVSLDILGAVEGEGSFVAGINYGMGPGQVMATHLVRLVRVGNAVVVDTTSGEASGRADRPDAEQVVSTRTALAPVLDAMEVYAR